MPLRPEAPKGSACGGNGGRRATGVLKCFDWRILVQGKLHVLHPPLRIGGQHAARHRTRSGLTSSRDIEVAAHVREGRRRQTSPLLRGVRPAPLPGRHVAATASDKPPQVSCCAWARAALTGSIRRLSGDATSKRVTAEVPGYGVRKSFFATDTQKLKDILFERLAAPHGQAVFDSEMPMDVIEELGGREGRACEGPAHVDEAPEREE